jgi:hypothetical protein
LIVTVCGDPLEAARRHPGTGLSLDSLPPAVRAMRVEPPGSVPADWERWNFAFYESLRATGDTTGFLGAAAVEGVVEGRLSLQTVRNPSTRELAYRGLALMTAAVGSCHPERTRALINTGLVEFYGCDDFARA